MPTKKNKKKIYKKQHIPKALREQCWITNFGHTFKHKCYIKWCKNTINVFDYHVGHNIPECQGGKLCLENLKPIFQTIKECEEGRDVMELLEGPIAHNGFKRLN